jgi:antitoxin component YwqK of YwqJK toxin-antitoxin module
MGLQLFSQTTLETSKRYFNDSNFKYEIYINYNLHPKIEKDKRYYWFKSQSIQSSVGASKGASLVNLFNKFYYSNAIAESGLFEKGLKEGIWKQWYQNGTLKQITTWKKGFKQGTEVDYYSNGIISKESNYKKNKLHGKQYEYNIYGKVIQEKDYSKGLSDGKWIDFTKETTVYYKKGSLKKTSLWKKLFYSEEQYTNKID